MVMQIKSAEARVMGYKEKASREQIMLLPDSIDEYVSEDNPVRVIDAFIDSLDLIALEFSKSIPADTGCPAYDPAGQGSA